MFWKKKKKVTQKPNQKSPNKQAIEDIRAQALENARLARENLGQDTIDRIAELMKQKQNSAMERAKAQIQTYESDKIASELLYLVREE